MFATHGPQVVVLFGMALEPPGHFLAGGSMLLGVGLRAINSLGLLPGC